MCLRLPSGLLPEPSAVEDLICSIGTQEWHA